MTTFGTASLNFVFVRRFNAGFVHVWIIVLRSASDLIGAIAHATSAVRCGFQIQQLVRILLRSAFAGSSELPPDWYETRFIAS